MISSYEAVGPDHDRWNTHFGNTLNMDHVREYFRLFDQEPLLEEILRELG